MVPFDGINSGSQRSRLGPIKRHPFSVFHMYTTQSFTVVLRFCCPVLVLARTSTERVGLRNAAVREFAYSGEDGNHVFGECRQRHDYSLLFPAAMSSPSCSGDGAARLLPSARRLSVIVTATSLHCIERDDYNNKAPCRFRMLLALPLGMLILFSKLQSL